MSAEELEKHIEFEETELENRNARKITASIKVSTYIIFAKDEEKRLPDIVDRVKTELKERIMRKIYADQRHKMYESLANLFCASPFDIEAIRTAQNNLLKAAKRQG